MAEDRKPLGGNTRCKAAEPLSVEFDGVLAPRDRGGLAEAREVWNNRADARQSVGNITRDLIETVMISPESVHKDQRGSVRRTVLPSSGIDAEGMNGNGSGSHAPILPGVAWQAPAPGGVHRDHPALGSIEGNERTVVTAATPLWAANLAVFDTETTGIDTSEARIVSATIALLGSEEDVVERYDWLLDPGVEIPEAAERVHGISTEVARASGISAAVGIQQIVAQLAEMIERGFPVVAYNAPFDLTLLRAEAARHGIAWPEDLSPVIDPLILDKQFDRYRKGKRTLEAVAAHHGVEIGNAHDAGDDAIAAGRVLQRIARKYADVIPSELDELHRAQIGWAAAQAASFQEYMRRARDPQFVADGRWPLR